MFPGEYHITPFIFPTHFGQTLSLRFCFFSNPSPVGTVFGLKFIFTLYNLYNLLSATAHSFAN